MAVAQPRADGAKAIFWPAATLGAPQTTVGRSVAADVHGDEAQAVGVGVRLDLDDARDRDAVPVRRRALMIRSTLTPASVRRSASSFGGSVSGHIRQPFSERA